ncbi:hypothetical protein Tco_0564147 [Tanacetum coccineum]
MWETNSYKAHKDHKKLYEALEKSMDRDHFDQLLTDLAEARRKKKKRHDSPKNHLGLYLISHPLLHHLQVHLELQELLELLDHLNFLLPHPPPSTNESDQSKSTAAPSFSKTATSAEYTTWTTTDTRLKPSVSSIPKDLHMDVDLAPDEHVHSSDDEDIRNDHIPKVILKQDWWKPRPEEDRPAIPEPAWSIPSSDLPVLMNNWASALASTYAPPPENSLLAQTGNMAIFMDWFYKKQGITELTQKDLEGPAFEIVKVFHPNPGQVTIQTDFFFNKDLEYPIYGSKGGRPVLSISKMKAACYPDVGLEQMWFQRQRFYIDKHTSEGDRRAVRTHMRILSVVRIKVFSIYGYDYMKTIVLRRVDLNEHSIAERDFKYMYPSDFEDLYLLNLQGHLNHLPPQDKKILSTAVNLWIRNLVIRQREKPSKLGIESYQT